MKALSVRILIMAALALPATVAEAAPTEFVIRVAKGQFDQDATRCRQIARRHCA
jgi:hypothetical protein